MFQLFATRERQDYVALWVMFFGSHFRWWICLGFALALCVVAHSQQGFAENKGQWHEAVSFRAEYPEGFFYIDDQGFTMQLLEDNFYEKLHSWWQDPESEAVGKYHAVAMEFTGADMSHAIPEHSSGKAITNYFIGNDPAKWAPGVEGYDRVKISQIYPGIDVRFERKPLHPKYDFIIAPGADPGQISLLPKGATGLRLDKGNLLIETSVGAFREMAPFAFQRDDAGHIVPVACEYRLKNSRVSYIFPEGYDTGRELVIDPEISFSTYVGSGSSSFGFTASYDADGNLYAGSVVFGTQYPTTPGAYQVNFDGGTVDCGISKFSSNGTQLIYSTFIGGLSNEAPHSLVVNQQNELYIFGTTSSADFPIANAFQSGFQGGSSSTGNGFTYSTGSDLFVTKLNAAGNALAASTFIGGSGNDGVSSSSGLDYNYGDRFRGEIVVDAAGNAYVASVTSSSDFPIVGGYASSMSGFLSGIIFKLSPNLNQLIWSTYSGGSGIESAISLQLASDNSVYFTGGTFSSNLPVSAGAYQAVNAGGVDGYVGHISADGGTLLNCTYNGTGAFDQNYFVQLDLSGNVYVVGQSPNGNYPISSDVYSNPNSGQYIQKFSADLTQSLWSTQVGSGSGNIDFSPSAFLVTNCNQIYISGWGGAVNTTGSTQGLPVSADAFQGNTDGSDFYIMVLEPDASALGYATFFGGSSSAEHVDGGTSRFDKNGTVYQAVCAGCFGNSDFPSQPGVWSPNNGSNLCNLAVFKFRLSAVSAVAEIDAPDVVCPGDEVNLLNQSTGADTFLWTFGDGTSSTDEEVTHSYSDPGTYTIQLYAEDSAGCLLPDSAEVVVTVGADPEIVVSDPPAICPGETVQITAAGATTWSWVPAAGLNFTNVANPIFSGSETTEYTVTGSTVCGSAVASVTAVVGNLNTTATGNAEICPGESTQLEATGGTTYNWTPSTGLSDANIANPLASPEATTAYAVTISSSDGCETVRIVTVVVLPGPPTLSGNEQVTSCNGAAVQLSVNGADTYNWSPPAGLSATNLANPTAAPAQTTIYTVTGTNICGSDEKEVTVIVSQIAVSATADSTVCWNTPFPISASGAVTYQWRPAYLVGDPLSAQTSAIIQNTTTLIVQGINADGCADEASLTVRIYPRANVRAGNDRVIRYGEQVQLESFSPYPILWEDSPWLTCMECNYPFAFPEETTTFYATIVSPEGCVEHDSVEVAVRGVIYVPNAFTPDGDGVNDLFKAKGIDISSFKMEIFDRWGEMVFRTEDMETGWNGSKNGSSYYAPADVYPYRIVAQEHKGDVFELTGHVVLIR